MRTYLKSPDTIAKMHNAMLIRHLPSGREENVSVAFQASNRTRCRQAREPFVSSPNTMFAYDMDGEPPTLILW